MLLQEIAAQRELMDIIGDVDLHACDRAHHEKRLGQLELRYQLMAEKKRLASVLVKFEERHGDLHSEPCLLCLEDVYVYSSEDVMEVFSCCGGFICDNCADDFLINDANKQQCPLCRGSYMEVNEVTDILRLAKKGQPWAQMRAGTNMMFGGGGYEKRQLNGIEWLEKAAAQNYPIAILKLAMFHGPRSPDSIVTRSPEIYSELLMKAANLGAALANTLLAQAYLRGENGFEQSLGEAYFRASVAFALNEKDTTAARFLGTLYHLTGPESHSYIACYYLNIAANKTESSQSSYFYSNELDKLSRHVYTNSKVHGFNMGPTVLAWLRKSRDQGYSDAREMLKKFESSEQRFCAKCGKDVQPGEKFKQCSKCKAQWYCSKECQVKAWKAGHKKDCKRTTVLKFEDCLNSE